MIGARAFRREQELLQVADHVLAAAVDLDEIAAAGHVLQRVAGVVQLAAVLVEVGDLQIGAQVHLAGIRLQLTQQDLEQGGLARAVRADDADLVAAQDRGRGIAQEDLVAERLRHAGDLDHLLAGGLRARGLHLHLAGELAARGALAAHRLQRGDAALVAGAAGLDALPDPHLFLCQQLVEARVLLRFGVQALLAPAQVVVVVAGPAGDAAAVDLDDAGGQRAQEAAVVGDEHEAAGEGLEEAFQPVDRLNVQVVGGFVQQQDVGSAHQRLRQQHAPLHAAGQRREIGVPGQLQPFQHLLHAAVQVPAVARLDAGLRRRHRRHVADVHGVMVAGQQRAEVAQAFGYHVEHAALHVLRHLLRHPRDHHPGLHAHLAVVGLELTGHQPHQGGLAGAVAADDADAFAGFDGQVDVVEQQRTADAEVDVLELEEGHARILRGPHANGPHRCGPSGCCLPRFAAYFSFAALRRASALSVFSHEKAVALCFLPSPSV